MKNKRRMKRALKRNYHSDSSFVDLLFNVFLGFVALFFIALLMIRPIKKDKDIEMKAEFIIKVTWPEEAKDDVDTYLEDPAGNILFYNARDVGLMHLDRDDLGTLNDSVVLANGDKIVLKENREVVTIRGIIPGEYMLNIHLFSRNNIYNGEEYESKEAMEPVEVTVEVLKLNPYKIISIKKLILREDGDELTVLRFTLNKEGKVVEMNNLEKSLVKMIKKDDSQEEQGEQ